MTELLAEKLFIPENNRQIKYLSPIVEFFAKESAVDFAYLFGSQATGRSIVKLFLSSSERESVLVSKDLIAARIERNGSSRVPPDSRHFQ